MSTLYTMIDELEKDVIIVLNRNYTDEQLREKLLDPGGYDEDWVNYIIENGIRIPEGECKVVRIHHTNTIIKTQNRFVTFLVHNGFKVILHPDGSFETILPIWDRMKER